LWAGISAFLLSAAAQAKRLDADAKLLNQFVEARIAEADQKPEIALAIYQDALKQKPDNILVAGKAYVQAIENQNWPLAVQAVKSIELNGSLEPEMPLILFVEAFNRRDSKGIGDALVKLENLKNFGFMVPMLQNWVNISRGDFNRSELSAVGKNPTGKFYLTDQNLLSFLATDNEKATPQLQKIVDRNEIRMSPLRMLAARHYLAKKKEDIARAVLTKRGTAPEAMLLSKIQTGKAKSLGESVTARSGIAFTLQRLSADLGAQRAHFLALLMSQSALQIQKDSDFANLATGRAFLGVKKSVQARNAFKKIGRPSPYYLIGLNAEIGSYIGDELYDEANERLSQEVQANRTAPELQILLGQVAQSKGDYKKAAENFSNAIESAEALSYSNAILANYYLALGSAEEQAGIWPKGLQSLKKANELLPNSANILNYLGYAQLERRENTDAAMDAIRKAHRLRSQSPAITDSLGWAYFIIGEHEKAVDYLERALAGQPQDPTINEHLGDAYWKVGRKFEARYAWGSAKLFADNADLERLSEKIDLGLTPSLVSP